MARHKPIAQPKPVDNPKALTVMLRRARKVFEGLCALAGTAHDLMLEAGRLCDSLRKGA